MNKTIDYLLSPRAIRERTYKIYEQAQAGKTHFKLNEDKLPEVCDFVLEVIHDNYPDLQIPFHSRWGHFQVGGVDRVAKLNEKLNDLDPMECARTKLDLVITSVLLDAGAGAEWKYTEDGRSYNRSEGLGVASFHMFMDGAFSSDGTPKAMASSLQAISASDIDKHFQVSANNPLVGSEGRAILLSALGKTLKANPNTFQNARPGNILDYMVDKFGKSFYAEDLLKAVLINFGEIWPARLRQDGISLGDVWHYSPLGPASDTNSLIPFHKLSQWLTYSLIEPIVEAGIEVKNVSALTGLAEYRNGGLLIDSGLIELKDKSLAQTPHLPSSDLIIEWRALTIVYLDKIGEMVRAKLGRTSEEFPLAKVLEGGTWWAGRRLAQKLRPDSSPPLKLDSDGTVF